MKKLYSIVLAVAILLTAGIIPAEYSTDVRVIHLLPIII